MISTYVLLFALGLFTIWCICRFLLPILVVWIIRKVLKINIKIGKIGLLAFGDVKFQVKPGVTIEAGWLSLSSSYISSCYRTPITLCCSHLRVQVDYNELKASAAPPAGHHEAGGGEGTGTAAGHGPGADTDPAKSFRRQQSQSGGKKAIKKIMKKLSRFQFCGLHLEDVDVFIMKWPVQDLLVLFHLQHMHGECTVNRDSLSAKLELENLNYRVIKSLNEPDTSVCVSEGGVCLSVTTVMTLIDSTLFPEEFTFLLDNLESQIRRDVSTRELKLKLKKIELKGKFEFGELGLEDVTGKVYGKINDLTVVSEVANLLNLTTFNLNTQLSESQLVMVFESGGLFVGYHHEDLCHLIPAIDSVILKHRAYKGAATATPKQQVSPSKRKRSTSLGSILRDKTLEISVTMDHSSYAIATATCSGLKGGFVTAKLASVIKPGLEDDCGVSQRDGRLELEVSSVYLKLAENSVSFTELQSRVHHWNTVLYVGTVFVRGNKLERQVTLDTMIDSCQAEVSSALSLVTCQLLTAILTSISSHMSSRSHILQRSNDHADGSAESVLTEQSHSGQKSRTNLTQSSRTHSRTTQSKNPENESEFQDAEEFEAESGKEGGMDLVAGETSDLDAIRQKMFRFSAIPPVVMRDVIDRSRAGGGSRGGRSGGTGEQKQRLDMTVNIQVTGVNLYLCNDLNVCTLLHTDSVYSDLRHGYSQFRVTDIKLVYMPMTEQRTDILRSCDLTKYSAYVKTLEGEFTTDTAKNKRELLIQMYDELYMEWTMHLHMCLLTAWNDLMDIKHTVAANMVPQPPAAPSQPSDRPPRAQKAVKSPLTTTVEVKTIAVLALQLQEGHRVCFTVPSLDLQKDQRRFCINTKNLTVTFDEHELFLVEGLQIELVPECDKISLERQNLPELKLVVNRTVCVRIESFQLLFPFEYHFDQCFRQLLSVNKWRKIVHKKQKKQFTADSPLPPDILINIQHVKIQLPDDPFEVTLNDNYELLRDENVEHGRRVAALESRIPQLRFKHGFLSASKISELHAALNKKSSSIYVQRSRSLYTAQPRRGKLLTASVGGLEVMAMADRSLHGRENCLKHMRDIDAVSPYPSADIQYSSLFGRMVNVSADSAKIQLRDFAVPMLDIKDLHLWGRLVGAEEVGLPKARRPAKIVMESPWGSVDVVKNMPALKFYHDFSSDVGLFNIAYGPCWEPVMSYVNLVMNLINRPSADPSPSLPFYDKARLLLHGRLTMCIASMSWLYHASFDPYNSSELMDWTWTDLVLDWTNAQWVLCGDLDIYARTASKYDDCRLLHLPNLRLCVCLEWVCGGDPDAHHLVQPTAPERVPHTADVKWDSYRDFRSRSLNLEISFETKLKAGATDTPACIFYASTIRWLHRIKNCITHVSRPIRRGKHWQNCKPKKTSLSRHYKNVHLSFKVHKFMIQYWVSNARQAGLEVQGHSFALLTGLQQTITRHQDDWLVRRARSGWSIKQLGVEQNDVTMWLCSTQADTGKTDKVKTSERPLLRHHALSVNTVLYQRAEESVDTSIVSLEHSVADEKHTPSHHVEIHQMRGSWTPHNRNIVLSLYDGYRKASTLRKNLSTEALKGFKVDPMMLSPPRSAARPAGANTSGADLSASYISSPVNYTGPGYDMLQKLVAESDSNFIAVHEELSGGGVQVDQLSGVTSCQQDDVVKKKWHVELYNSQVMLAGCETPGHVIVGAAKATVMTCDHRPVWRDQRLRSKSTITGSLECMQYYATINPKVPKTNETNNKPTVSRQSTATVFDPMTSSTPHTQEATTQEMMTSSQEDVLDLTDQQEITWLSNEHIDDQQEEGQSIMGIEGMLGSGQRVGGIVCETQSDTDEMEASAPSDRVQLQRIISRCKCQIFYAGYGDLEADGPLVEVPVPPPVGEAGGEGVGVRVEEGVDTLTLLHHDLNICTNSLQYDMILDIVNNLLLFVDSKKKERDERQRRMKFKLHLNSIEDQKTPVIQRQNQLREKVSTLRQLEREMYIINKEILENPGDENLVMEREEIERRLEECKELVNEASEELAILISAFKETQLQAAAEMRATMRRDDALLVKRYEVCFKHAEWRMTEQDGQIGIADVMLRNFLYTKLSKDDDSGSHQMELGYLKVTNLLSDSVNKDLLALQDLGQGTGLGVSDKQMMLRILCKFKAPVGGIQIKEHLEVNVLPVNLQLTKRFYREAMQFFFPDRQKKAEPTQEVGKDVESEATSSKGGSKKKGRATFYCDTAIHTDDIDKMKERAAKNNMFMYVKIPEVPLTVSYKGLKDKNVTDVNNLRFVVPTLEYHNRTWQWLDLLMAMKADCKKVLISQAIKQKLHMRSRVADLYELVQHGENLREEDEKAKMLFGTQVLGDKPAKKSLFGRTSSKP